MNTQTSNGHLRRTGPAPLLPALGLMLLLLGGCAITINVKPDDTVITLPNLSQCDGVEVALTVRQGGKPTRTVRGRIEDGRVSFESRELRAYDFSQRFTFELRILSRSETCPYPRYALWLANHVSLDSVDDDAYEISGSEFERQ